MMASLTIIAAEYVLDRHRPTLLLETDAGMTASISVETSKPTLWRDGVVFLGPEFEGLVSAVIPADPDDGRMFDLTVTGGTRNAFVRQAYGGLVGPGFKPRRIDVPDGGVIL